VIKGRGEIEVDVPEEIGHVYIESALVVSIAIQIEEQFSNQEEKHSMLVSMLALDSLEYQLLGPLLLFLYYADATVYQDPRLRQHTFDLHPYREGSNMHSYYDR
jgi:hypothetical protein